MAVSWEFLLGLLLPAYGLGYLWLIKTAREDPVLYAEVEKPLWKICALLVVFGVLAFRSFHGSTEYPSEFRLSAMVLSGLLATLPTFILLSLSFFRRITRLPARQSQADAKPPTKPTSQS